MRARPLRREDLPEVRRRYEETFPEYERADFDALVHHAARGDAQWVGLYGDGLEGFAYTMCTDRMLFILYLAVNEELRGRGIGSAALIALRSMHPGRKVFLNIEPPDEPDCPNREQRARRQAFYVGNGFVPCGRIHAEEADYIVMCYMSRIFEEEMEAFRIDSGLDLLFGSGAVYESNPSVPRDVRLRAIAPIYGTRRGPALSGPGICRRRCPRCPMRSPASNRTPDSHPLSPRRAWRA